MAAHLLNGNLRTLSLLRDEHVADAGPALLMPMWCSTSTQQLGNWLLGTVAVMA